jgi:catechol 2,3-dioxygenase-like lactoylglutathione lyase family enzyme
MADLRISELTLAAPAGSMDALERFYGDDLGLAATRDGERLEVGVGPARLGFEDTGEGEPFYHFAFLVPGDGFEPARAWLAERAEIVGDPVYDFSFWDALACYCLDPAGNIVELIAHRGIGTTFRDGRDLLGVSEIGLVLPDPEEGVDALRDELGLELWSGDAAHLAFVGRRAHTLILCPTDRGWLPTDRPAEPHPVDVTFAGAGRAGEVTLPGAPHRVATATS